MSAYVCIRQHTLTFRVRAAKGYQLETILRQHTSAYVSIRQHTLTLSVRAAKVTNGKLFLHAAW